MPILNNVLLKAQNSFAVQACAKQMITIASLNDLVQLDSIISGPFYILGAGTNTLFVEQHAPAIIKMGLRGITLEQDDDAFYLTVAAGENWHELVEYTIGQQIYGLENLAYIPGTVGAAPVQNIGAYGAEFSAFCSAVQWYDFATKQITWLGKDQCCFAYRDSIFKSKLKNSGIILAVKLALPKQWRANLSYAGLDLLPQDSDASTIMHQVIAIRSKKLPDYRELPNAGSFFKNPIVSKDKLKRLQHKHPDIPCYPQANGEIKVAAAWLIEQAGLKGYRNGEVGVHDRQALVLVNYGTEHGVDLVQLAKQIQGKVYQQFSIKLEAEVRLVNEQGQCPELLDGHNVN
jgi:UDP-N-acetylmuramate dehydrogenase